MDQVPLGQTNSQFTKFFEISWYFITSVIIVLGLIWLMELRMFVLYTMFRLEFRLPGRRCYKIWIQSKIPSHIPSFNRRLNKQQSSKISRFLRSLICIQKVIFVTFSVEVTFNPQCNRDWQCPFKEGSFIICKSLELFASHEKVKKVEAEMKK